MSEPPERKGFSRPWEGDDGDDAKVVPLPGFEDEAAEAIEVDEETVSAGVTVDDGSDDIDWIQVEETEFEVTPTDYTASVMPHSARVLVAIRSAKRSFIAGQVDWSCWLGSSSAAKPRPSISIA